MHRLNLKIITKLHIFNGFCLFSHQIFLPDSPANEWVWPLMQILMSSEMAERQEAVEKKGALINHKWIIILQIIKSWRNARNTTQNTNMTKKKVSFHLWSSPLHFPEISLMKFSFEGSGKDQNEALLSSALWLPMICSLLFSQACALRSTRSPEQGWELGLPLSSWFVRQLWTSHLITNSVFLSV